MPVAFALVGAARPCRPAAVPAGARRRSPAPLRRWFAARDFVEVETAILQVSPGNETHLHAFATELIGAGRERHPLYLHTSPEFACKKLLAAGERRIFDFARVFRNRERRPLHHPEFTLLEWYRANEPYERADARTAPPCWRLAAERPAAPALHLPRTAISIRSPRRSGSPSRRRFARHAGIDLLGDACGRRGGPRRALPAAAQRPACASPPTTPGATFSAACWSEQVEPKLGIGRATILDEYPVCRRRRWRGRPTRCTRRRTLRALCLRRGARQRASAS